MPAVLNELGSAFGPSIISPLLTSHKRWFVEYKKGRPCDSRYANRRKKEVKVEAEMTLSYREQLKKLIALYDLLDIDLNTYQAR